MTGPNNRSNWILLAVAAVAALAVGLNFWYRQKLEQQNTQATSNSSRAADTIGQMRPSFRLPDTLGLQHSISEWDGRVIVLNFWATWCTPCRREIPAFVELQSAYEDRGVQFVGVALDDSPDVKAFIERLGVDINYPMLIGEDRGIEIAKDYGNQFGVLPYTVVIARSGRIAFIQYGELTRAQAEQWLLRLS